VSSTRRYFLRGLGGLGLALPWLEQLAPKNAFAQSTPGGPRRVIVMTYQMGIPASEWRPIGTGTNFTLPSVTAALEPFRSRCLFVSDLDNQMLGEGGNAFEFGHPGKTEAALTGTLTTGAFPTTNNNHVDQILGSVSTDGGANAESVEQRIGRSLRTTQPFASIDLGVDGDRQLGRINSRFFFEGRATPVSLECSPSAAVTRYFVGVTPGNPDTDRALRELRARNKSVLDAVRASFADLSRGLGADDRRRLDEHAARIRQIELQPPPPAACTTPDNLGLPASPRLDQASPTQIRILAQAMACDLAPVGRLEFGNQQNPRFGIPDLDNTLDTHRGSYDWHAMVHGDPLPGTSTFLRPGRDDGSTTFDVRLLAGYRFFVEQFAALLAELDRYPEGEGTTVLDNSLLILATDFGDGDGHFHGKMGYVLAGNLGAARRGYHLRATPANGNFYTTSNFNVNQLLHSILDMAGVTENGQAVEFGLRGFLSKVGRPRRIDELFA
jgi:hypothetical protein